MVNGWKGLLRHRLGHPGASVARPVAGCSRRASRCRALRRFGPWKSNARTRIRHDLSHCIPCTYHDRGATAGPGSGALALFFSAPTRQTAAPPRSRRRGTPRGADAARRRLARWISSSNRRAAAALDSTLPSPAGTGALRPGPSERGGRGGDEVPGGMPTVRSPARSPLLGHPVRASWRGHGGSGSGDPGSRWGGRGGGMGLPRNAGSWRGESGRALPGHRGITKGYGTRAETLSDSVWS